MTRRWGAPRVALRRQCSASPPRASRSASILTRTFIQNMRPCLSSTSMPVYISVCVSQLYTAALIVCRMSLPLGSHRKPAGLPVLMSCLPFRSAAWSRRRRPPRPRRSAATRFNPAHAHCAWSSQADDTPPGCVWAPAQNARIISPESGHDAAEHLIRAGIAPQESFLRRCSMSFPCRRPSRGS